jgi:hypothetical protein
VRAADTDLVQLSQRYGFRVSLLTGACAGFGDYVARFETAARVEIAADERLWPNYRLPNRKASSGASPLQFRGAEALIDHAPELAAGPEVARSMQRHFHLKGPQSVVLHQIGKQMARPFKDVLF